MLRRLRTIFQRDKIDRDMRDEMEAHLARATERLIARGVTPADAKLAARREFGNVGVLQEESRDVRGVQWLESLLGDLRFALRHFARRPVHSLTIVCVLSLGIGAHAGVFTMLRSMTVRPAPGVPDDASLVQIRGKERLVEEPKWQPRFLSHSEWRELAGARGTFTSVAASQSRSVVIRAQGAELGGGRVHFVSDNYFSTLGIGLALGAGLPPTSATESGEPVAVISHVLWQNTFAGAADVLGKTIVVNGMTVRIVGVAPEKFLGVHPANSPNVAWMQLPMAASVMRTSAQALASNDSPVLVAVARLAPGVSHAEASAIARVIGSRAIERRAPLEKMVYDTDVASMSVSNELPWNDDLGLISILWPSIAMLVLLIACTNVSALVLGAAVARRHEIAVRLSLGASRARIVRQLVTENILLALGAGALGLLLHWWFATAMSRRASDLGIHPDASSIAFTLFVTLGTGLLFGLSPALHATRRGFADVLKDSGGGQASRTRLQRAFIVAQIALTQPLLVGLAIILGLVPPESGVMANGVDTRLIALRMGVNGREGWERVEEKLRALPGVVGMLPDVMYFDYRKAVVHPSDRVESTRSMEPLTAQLNAASPGYFALLDLPMVRGRELLPTDAPNSAVVIGSGFARSLWGASDPIGRRFQSPDSAGHDREFTVVGVYDSRYQTTTDDDEHLYVMRASAEVPRVWLIRTSGPAAPMIDSVRSIVRATLPAAPINGIETIASMRAAIKRESFVISAVTAGAGLLALFLTSLGLYGVIALAVNQRRREIGIRMALGARAAQVVGMLFQGGVRLSLVGLLVGLPLSLAVLGMLAKSIDLPEMSMPLVGAAIAFVVLGVASLATWVPARRAASVNPVTALRAE